MPLLMQELKPKFRALIRNSGLLRGRSAPANYLTDAGRERGYKTLDLLSPHGAIVRKRRGNDCGRQSMVRDSKPGILKFTA
jgi:hypothetical protein